ncbi:recombination regulator RecX [uncultured Propionivibrio sp.]|uniref:recombination regulator RecX n=1 Tax=uncultured Propionivibrio sp. TaxID=426737 RepID=UPI0029C0C412|nr:recombination regulator RecX [uncultured Propionivibrio sp.]
MDPSLRERALRLLARREHSRAELARKLAVHSESAEALDAVLDDLVARRLLSDERYVEARLNVRAARFGNARLAQELRTQGVDDELVRSALADCEDEWVRACQVWRRRFGERPASGDAAGRAKEMRFLMSRGFSGETIRRVLRGDLSDD